MTGKRILKVVAALIAGGILLFIFMLYATIKTKSTGIDKYPPFREWVGKKGYPEPGNGCPKGKTEIDR